MPNGWDFFDLHDNVAEWCQDWRASYPEAESVVDPIGPDKQDMLNRVVRGGSFKATPIGISSSWREGPALSSRAYYVGFCVARTHEPN